MSRRRTRGKKVAYGQGKHRLARIQRFEAKHPDSKKAPKNARKTGKHPAHGAPYGTSEA